jgi:hypothetical protein
MSSIAWAIRPTGLSAATMTATIWRVPSIPSHHRVAVGSARFVRLHSHGFAAWRPFLLYPIPASIPTLDIPSRDGGRGPWGIWQQRRGVTVGSLMVTHWKKFCMGGEGHHRRSCGGDLPRRHRRAAVASCQSPALSARRVLRTPRLDEDQAKPEPHRNDCCPVSCIDK